MGIGRSRLSYRRKQEEKWRTALVFVSNYSKKRLRPADAGFHVRQFLSGGRLPGKPWRSLARLTLIGQREKTREFPRRGLAIRVPEFGIAIIEVTRTGNNDLQRQRPAGALGGVLANIVLNADIAFAHARPRDCDALRRVPHSRVAHVAGEHIRREGLQGQVRVFDSP